MTCQQTTFDLAKLYQHTLAAAQMAEVQGLLQTARALYAVAETFPAAWREDMTSTAPKPDPGAPLHAQLVS